MVMPKTKFTKRWKIDPKKSLKSNKTLIRALEQTADNVMITDKDGTIIFVNNAFVKTTGYTKTEVVGQNPRILKSGQHTKDYYQKLWTTILSGGIFRATTTNKKKSGEFYHSDQTISSIKDHRGNITHFISVWKDVSERIKFEEKLKDLNKSLEFERTKLEQILNFDKKISQINNLEKLIDFIIEKSCMILESERCSLMLLDEESQELCIKGAIGMDEKVIAQEGIKLRNEIASRVIEENLPLLVKDVEQDKRIKRKNRLCYHSKSFMSVPIKLNERLIGVVNVTDKNLPSNNVYTELDLKILTAIVRQAAIAIENAKIYKELRYLTITDSMTNLYNYRYFSRNLDREINRVNRFQRPLCLLMMDIDHFKAYNDSFGHVAGDHLLRQIGKVLLKSVRDIDIVCRYAGDEFAIIMSETDLQEAKLAAERILHGVSNLEFARKVTVSIGIARYHLHSKKQELVLKADNALYEAKKNGRNRICVY